MSGILETGGPWPGTDAAMLQVLRDKTPEELLAAAVWCAEVLRHEDILEDTLFAAPAA